MKDAVVGIDVKVVLVEVVRDVGITVKEVVMDVGIADVGTVVKEESGVDVGPAVGSVVVGETRPPYVQSVPSGIFCQWIMSLS